MTAASITVWDYALRRVHERVAGVVDARPDAGADAGEYGGAERAPSSALTVSTALP
jgi:hypothetical protein